MSFPTTARQAGAETAADEMSPASPYRTLLERCAAVTAVALTTMAATVALAPVTHAVVAAEPRSENAAAAAAVVDLTAGGPGSADRLPADFAAVIGYRPGIERGLLVNPSGDCSSPVPLPAEFELACRAHDLGYDLLRYADRSGAPLGPWARQAVDATLDRRMQESCTSRGTAISRAECFTMADVADAFVDLNSRRQDYGAPVAESGLNSWHFGIFALAGLGLTALLALARTLFGGRLPALRRPRLAPVAAGATA
ncbi:hypothetical protein [Nocardia goodfellowii]|uniref:Phospholipase A2 n=1 Tax=Nocardia goodfellowii TaxID=882446 RepID=A0ABS4QDZ4_9NOCA|nr:hypothetical protein [Nocardia goodfellowii]MBP2189922.1 hypothetical protein [Nocardia goodfellowii]